MVTFNIKREEDTQAQYFKSILFYKFKDVLTSSKLINQLTDQAINRMYNLNSYLNFYN